MTVKLIKSGETLEVNDIYGARLIEQGKAVLCACERAQERKEAAQETNESETPKHGKKAEGKRKEAEEAEEAASDARDE